jgi:adenylate cyclase
MPIGDETDSGALSGSWWTPAAAGPMHTRRTATIMRIGVRLAISALVLASILVSVGAVHALWWRTAEANSRELAATINAQIVAAVEKEIAALDSAARSAHSSIRTLFFQNVLEAHEADKREFVFLSQLQAQPAVSWIAFGLPDGTFAAAHKLGDERLEMIEVSRVDGVLTRRSDRYLIVVGDIEFEQRHFEKTDYKVTDQEWYRASMAQDTPRWFDITVHPNGVHPAIAYAGPIDVYQQRQGVLAVVIEHTRLSRFLSQLSVGKSGAAFILGQDGAPIAVPDPDADELKIQHASKQPLFGVVRLAVRQADGGQQASSAGARQTREVMSGESYAVTLTPLAFPGWRLATVIPEQEFLGSVHETTRRLLVGIVVLVVAAGLLSAWLARRIIAAPLLKVAGELGHVERFELDRVRRHPSRLVEIEHLSAAIANMANGLAAFGKYLPGDIVKMLTSEAVEARPGGSIRPITILFADIAGFTGLSERLGDRIVPLLGSYFDVMSREINANAGTIDKFIGDAVMAFWGAPRSDPDHAVHACRAALACQRAIRMPGLTDDNGRPLGVRIGINSGEVLVGNIGSEVRLNYTVIGDAVNVASRLEGVNKQYGTHVIIGEETRRLAGDRVHVRELDRLAVYGRAQGLHIYELLGIAEPGVPPPSWVALYEAGLAAYRARNFAAAMGFFQMVLVAREGDPPSRLMVERCRKYLESPPEAHWEATAAMDSK